MKRAIACLMLCFLVAQPAWADDVSNAVWAYRRGHYDKAVAALRPLAQRGNPYAQFNIAVMYDDGVGLPRNFGLALRWYKAAAESGLADAQYMVGRFYGSGRGVTQSPARALYWFELASAAGHKLAPLQRDQHWTQVRSPRRDQVADDAARWQASHPRQLSCRIQRCLYPAWTSKPGWNILDQQDFFQ